MLLFLYGPDTYRINQKIKAVRKHYQEQFAGALIFKTFHAPECELDELKRFLETNSLFEEKKMALIKEFWAFPAQERQAVVELVRTFRDDKTAIIVIQTSTLPRKNDSIFNTLLKTAHETRLFKLLNNQERLQWLEKELKKRELTLTPKAKKLLLAWAGSDLWRLSNECDKLKWWAYAQTMQSAAKQPLVLDELAVRFLVAPSLSEKVFALSDALGQHNIALALRLLRGLLAGGDPPLRILSFLVTHYRTLLIVRDAFSHGATSAHELGLHPFVFQKARATVRQSSSADIIKRMEALALIEQKIKSGRFERPEEALELFILDTLS